MHAVQAQHVQALWLSSLLKLPQVRLSREMALHSAALGSESNSESSRCMHPYQELDGSGNLLSQRAVVHMPHLASFAKAAAFTALLLCSSCLLMHTVPQRFWERKLPGLRRQRGHGREGTPAILVDGQKYNAVQYLGMNLFTAPGTEVDGCFDYGAEMDQCYLGSSKVRDDVARRMEIMIEAIDRVFASSHWDRNPNTLKIVLFPEFYWRGKQGAYRIQSGLENVTHPTAHWIFHQFAHARFKHWLIVDGTVVMAQAADERYVRMSKRPDQNVSYFNFAPVHVGGTSLTYLKFKRFISGIDFIRARPEGARMVPAPPRNSRDFCRKHPHSNGCIYQRLPEALLQQLGFGRDIELPDGLLTIGGLRIGLEICLDHAMGDLCNNTLAQALVSKLLTSW